jgi:hypothetical protein
MDVTWLIFEQLNCRQKNGVGGCFRILLRHLLSGVPEMQLMYLRWLASWYWDTENCNQPIIIIIDDLEQC